MSSGKSAGSHSGPYGATGMTSFSWFSGSSESSRNCMSISAVGRGPGSGRRAARRSRRKFLGKQRDAEVAGMDADRARELDHLEDLLAGRARCERHAHVLTHGRAEQVGRGHVDADAEKLDGLRIEHALTAR